MIEDTMFDNDCYAVFLEKEHEKREAMDDTISRQAATSIPILPKEHRKIFKSIDDAFETGWNEALSCVNMLPSAQPLTNCSEIPNGSDDTISRQAAIDEIRKCRFVVDAIEKIRGLPSAEPEIIRCKDCKHWTNNIGDSKLRDNYCNDEAHGFYYQCSEDDYCSFAERRTDEQTVS